MGEKDAVDAKYKSVVAACIIDCRWKEPDPPNNWPRAEKTFHIAATVFKSYKGQWANSETVWFLYKTRADVPTLASGGPVPNNVGPGTLVYLFLPARNGAAITLQSEDWGLYDRETEAFLERMFPAERSRWP